MYAMASRQPSPFGTLLRRHRRTAGLTQEDLAERAGLSANTISALEAGRAEVPRQDTLDLLVEALAAALQLTPSDRAGLAGEFAAASRAARREAPPAPDMVASATSTPVTSPPLPALPAPRHNLPSAPSSIVGRAREQAEVQALQAEARLVTLTGAGGAGKTRLALAAAEAVLAGYPDGVWLLELASLADPTLLPQAVAQVLGVREEPARPLLETLAHHLRDRRLLLVLDNCEHLLEACAQLASALLRGCPHLRLLATSREALDVAGEQRYRVPSLPVPSLTHLPPPEQLAEWPAVALFLARARQRQADFALTAQNARAVAQVCVRLDGMPLAIELAAARVSSLAVEGIAARLDDRFRLLTGGARDALPRQRTLRAALDWSYDMLGESERLLLDRLAVFAGSWTLAAAEVVCMGEGVEAWEVLDLLSGLVSKSLVQAEERAGGELRYALLETVRQYGRERLAAAGAAEALQDRHLAYYLTLAEEVAPQLGGRRKVCAWTAWRLSMTTCARRCAEQVNGWRVRWGCGWRERCGVSGTCGAISAKGGAGWRGRWSGAIGPHLGPAPRPYAAPVPWHWSRATTRSRRLFLRRP
jgi:predicted ATPase/transcriptional regulator with XRE-family HTH domain